MLSPEEGILARALRCLNRSYEYAQSGTHAR